VVLVLLLVARRAAVAAADPLMVVVLCGILFDLEEPIDALDRLNQEILRR
jgi:hypothetical protein